MLGPPGHVVQGPGDLVRQTLVVHRQRRRELAGRTSAQQRGGDPRGVPDPQQGHLQRGQVQPVGRSDDRFDHPPAAGLQIRLDEPREVVGGGPRPARGAVAILAGEYASAQRRPWEQAHPESPEGRQHLDLGPPGEQGVLDLRAGDRRAPGEGALPGGGLGRLPAHEVGHSGVARPPGVDGVVDRLQGLGQRCCAEGVDLPKVDVVGAQPVQRALEVAQQRPPGGVDDALAVPDHEARLGGDHHLVPVAEVLDQPADDPLGVTGPVGRRRVDQRAAGLAEHLQQPPRLLGRGVAAPGHRAEPESGDPQAAGPDQASFHGETLWVFAGVSTRG